METIEWRYIQPFEQEEVYSISSEEMSLLGNVQTVKHSRYITPQKARNIWEMRLAAKGVPLEQLAPEFWLQIRRSTFPLTGLTDQEESTLREFLLHLLEAAAQTGMTLLIIWLWVKSRKDLDRDAGTHIQIGRADNIAIDHSLVDQSRVKVDGIQPVPPLETTPENVQTIEVVVRVPPGYTKPVFVALIPPDMVLTFPRSFDYLECRDVPSELISILRRGDEVEKCKAAHLLGIYDNRPEVRAALLKGLSDDSPAVRATIIDVLAELRAEEAVPSLARAIEDPNETIQNLAAIALAKIGTSDALTAIVTAFKDAKWEDITLSLVMQSAYQVIIDAILDDYQQADQTHLAWYNKVLVTFPNLATEVILQILESNQEAKQISALLGIREILKYSVTPPKEEHVHKILEIADKLLAHKSFETRYQAIGTLGASKNPKAIKPLTEALWHDDVNTRAFAAYYLDGYRDNPEALKQLVDAYRRESDKDLRKKIGELLGEDRPKSQLERLWNLMVVPLLLLLGVYLAVGFVIRQALSDWDIPYLPPINAIMLPFFVIAFLGGLWILYDIAKRLYYGNLFYGNHRDDIYWHKK